MRRAEAEPLCSSANVDMASLEAYVREAVAEFVPELSQHAMVPKSRSRSSNPPLPSLDLDPVAQPSPQPNPSPTRAPLPSRSLQIFDFSERKQSNRAAALVPASRFGSAAADAEVHCTPP